MAKAPAVAVLSKFRDVYKPPPHFNVNVFKSWFPGHMHKGLKIMQGKSLLCDFSVEVHDARIPLTGRNNEFAERLATSSRILVLNKVDLAKQKRLKVLSAEFSPTDHIFYCNSKTNVNSSIKKLLWFIKKQITEFRDKDEDTTYKVLVCGIPNTGKSTFINHVRRMSIGRGNATPVGPNAGVTRSVMNKILINENPKIYVIDTPGIMMPKIRNVEEGLKLAAVGSFKDAAIGEDIIADYILYTLNKFQDYRYTALLDLPRPCNDFDVLMAFVAKKMGFLRNGHPDIIRCSAYVIACFRSGLFGRFTLD